MVGWIFVTAFEEAILGHSTCAGSHVHGT